MRFPQCIGSISFPSRKSYGSNYILLHDYQKSFTERVGFEPTVPRGTLDFKSSAIDHSATSPKYGFNIITKLRRSITDIMGLILNQNSTENKMTTHFITAEIDLQENPLQLKQEIEAQLEKKGEPLRWAITEVDQEQEKVIVEAIVTTEE